MKKLTDLSYVNGKPEQSISVSDRGLSYGDGLFETILCLDGRLILLEEHLGRLARDCQRLDIALDAKALSDELAILSANIKDASVTTGVVKIIVTRRFTGRGYAYAKNTGSNRLLQYYAGLSYPVKNLQGVRLSLCDHRLPSNKQLAGIKHLNRLDQVIAQNAIKKPFCQEGIVFGAGGEVIECVSSNIFIINEGCLLTPDLGCAGVQGVMRDYILSEVATDLKLATSVKKLYIDDLMSANEVFVCNSVFGLWPVVAINVKEYLCGEATVAVQRQINKLGYGSIYK